MTDSEHCNHVLANYHAECDIKTVKVHHPMPHSTLYELNGGEYYILQDDSAMDDVIFVAKQISEVATAMQGKILPNPVKQPDGAIFASGYDNKEYYVWKSL